MKMKNKIWIILIVILSMSAFFIYKGSGDSSKGEVFQQIKPFVGNIKKIVSTTGTVSPQNRLEIKSPISGRIEQILVKEGQSVHAGDTLVLMSSTERAALLDAARSKGEEEVAYWQEVYKAAPLIAPIDGEVIVRSVEPGQTVTTSDAVIVLSDRLIIQADVDETDIGAIHVGQKAMIGLDAYPDISIKAEVDHISYESELVNNVNIYSVEIVLENIPDVIRSGMSANVEIVTVEKQDVLILPILAVKEEDGQKFVTIKNKNSKGRKEVLVQVGLQNDDSCEIMSGLSDKDIVLTFAEESFSIKDHKSSGNPFMPSMGKK